MTSEARSWPAPRCPAHGRCSWSRPTGRSLGLYTPGPPAGPGLVGSILFALGSRSRRAWRLGADAVTDADQGAGQTGHILTIEWGKQHPADHLDVTWQDATKKRAAGGRDGHG